MSLIIEKMSPIIEKTVEKLKKKKFKKDPIAGEHFSKIVSLMGSAYKRHGFILEKAILEQLKTNPDFEVWEDRQFSVSQGADLLVDSAIQDPTSIISSETNYDENGHRFLQVDTIVYDKIKKQISAYEIKRGNGKHDAGKRRQILRDLLCIQVLLKSYGVKKGFEVLSASSIIIFYYGECSIGKPFSLSKDELDKHFGYPIFNELEKVNEYFRSKLFDLLTV
ncbi:MAG: hypothetical protein PSN37_05840 [Alphaproteobacteria bacterium]|nr:hypothetical protein [Alphaproteobacteria bacterium]